MLPRWDQVSLHCAKPHYNSVFGCTWWISAYFCQLVLIKILIQHSDLGMLPFSVPFQSAEGQQDLRVFSMVTKLHLSIFPLCCVTTFPLVLGGGIVQGTELGCEIN